MTEDSCDIVIIGAGPVGLFAVFEAGMLKMQCHVFDSLEAVGGQCAALYPEKPIYDIPGFPDIAAQALIDNLAQQAAPFKPVYHLGEQVTGLARTADGGWQVSGSRGSVVTAKALVIAAGAGAFGPNRPPLEHLADYEGRSVFYLVQRRDDFRGKRLVIAGGGDSAVDWANALAEVAEIIYMIHRRPKFRAAPDSVARMEEWVKRGKIEMVIPYQLDALIGGKGQLTEVIVSDLDNNKRSLKADILLPFFGLAMNLGPIAEWGLNLDKHHILVDPATQATNQPGIFAIGDICHYPNKLKLILTGFAEAAQAMHQARQLVYPDQALHFEYSTSKGVAGF